MAATPISPAFAWEDIDQSLVLPKIDELGREMNRILFADERQISYDARRNGNSAYFIPAFFDKQVERTDEWARSLYEIYCDGWYLQGRSKNPGFVRSVCYQAIVPFISFRETIVLSHVDRINNFTGRSAKTAALSNWHRSIKRLTRSWEHRLRMDAKALEHITNLTTLSGSQSGIQFGSRKVAYEARLDETIVELDAQKEALTFAAASGQSVPKINQAIRALSELKTRLEHAIVGNYEVQASFSHSASYRQIEYQGKTYKASATAAKVIEALHQNLRDGLPPMTTKQIRRSAGLPANGGKMYDWIVKGGCKGLWNTLIVQPDRGFYRLDIPPNLP